MLTKLKNNKIFLSENTLIFEQSGVKIITGVADADVSSTIRDMTINPGDTVISTEGNTYVMNADNDLIDISNPSGGGGSGADTELSNLTAPTEIGVALLPLNNLDKDIGSEDKRWNGIYAGVVVVDSIATLAGDIDVSTSLNFLNTGSIINLVDPASPQGAATKNYVDTTISSSASLVKTKYSFSYTDFNASATSTLELPLFSLPAKAILTDIVIHETLQFANSGGNVVTAYVGLTALSSVFSDLTLQEISSGTTFNRAAGIPANGALNMTTPTDIVVTLEAVGGSPAELTTLTAGTFDVYIEYKLLAE